MPKYKVGDYVRLLDGYLWRVTSIEWDPMTQSYVYNVVRTIQTCVSTDSIVEKTEKPSE